LAINANLPGFLQVSNNTDAAHYSGPVNRRHSRMPTRNPETDPERIDEREGVDRRLYEQGRAE
jgi:hypothetical protein